MLVKHQLMTNMAQAADRVDATWNDFNLNAGLFQSMPILLTQ